MKYRDGEKLIEAVQYTGEPTEGVRMQGETPVTDTREGPTVLRKGDWIVTDANGERYVYLPHAFKAHFKPDKES